MHWKSDERYYVVDASWDAIIDKGLFEKVQEKLKTNKRSGYAATYDFFLSNLLTCDECGCRLFGQSGTGSNGKYHYYGHKKKTDCSVQRYSADSLEKIVKKKLFALVQNEALRSQFTEAIEFQMKNRPRHIEGPLRNKTSEIKELKLSLEKLTNLVVSNPDVPGIKSILAKIGEREELLERHEQERERLQEMAILRPESNSSDPEFVLSGIEKMRQDNFRKAKVSRKKAFLREVVKGIHVHPQNALRIDFWAGELGGPNIRQHGKGGGPKVVGQVLPYRELAHPLKLSFQKFASKRDKFAASREGVGLGTSVLYCGETSGLPVGSVTVGGSPRHLNGGPERDRTADLHTASVALSPAETTGP